MKKLNFFLILTICLSYLTIHGSQEQSTWWNRVKKLFLDRQQGDWTTFQNQVIEKLNKTPLSDNPLAIELYEDVKKVIDPIVIKEWLSSAQLGQRAAILFVAVDLNKNPLIMANEFKNSGYAFFSFRLPFNIKASEVSFPR